MFSPSTLRTLVFTLAVLCSLICLQMTATLAQALGPMRPQLRTPAIARAAPMQPVSMMPPRWSLTAPKASAPTTAQTLQTDASESADGVAPVTVADVDVGAPADAPGVNQFYPACYWYYAGPSYYCYYDYWGPYYYCYTWESEMQTATANTSALPNNQIEPNDGRSASGTNEIFKLDNLRAMIANQVQSSG
ncbi:hypothetical protein HK102_013655 [Quaeritorhiza haematococci]|nr:hypothetical protein HK102_013655 [Quaeritorhiza haematococci]